MGGDDGLEHALWIFLDNARETIEFFLWTLVFVLFGFSAVWTFARVGAWILWMTDESKKECYGDS